MKEDLFADQTFLRNLYDTLPIPVMVVDDDVRILSWNRAAESFLEKEPARIYRQRGGDVLECLNAVNYSDGCGRSPACNTCVLRNSVNEVCWGRQVHRKQVVLEKQTKNSSANLNLMVTAAPFPSGGEMLVILILQDMNELVQLRRLLPICSHCKKIRNDQNYWQDVALYLNQHLDLMFTHSICPECRAAHSPESK